MTETAGKPGGSATRDPEHIFLAGSGEGRRMANITRVAGENEFAQQEREKVEAERKRRAEEALKQKAEIEARQAAAKSQDSASLSNHVSPHLVPDRNAVLNTRR